MDGGMVNIRGEGWRKLKVGTVFDVEKRLERNPQTQELDEMAHGVHATEHLYKAAVALYPKDADLPKRQSWYKKYKYHLYMGRIDTIISVLHEHHASQWATYFERHKRRMQYLEFREAGLPIGSGTVESGVKQFKQRLSGTAMRWHLANARRICVIQAAVLGKDFHSLWHAA